MINLTAEVLVPGRTRFKLRNGYTATFTRMETTDIIGMSLDNDGGRAWSVWLDCGRSDRGREHPDDIVAIGKKWEPKPGDKITVCGIAISNHEGNESYMNFNCGHDSGDDFRILRKQESGQAEHYVFTWNKGKTEYRIHRDNIRRAK